VGKVFKFFVHPEIPADLSHRCKGDDDVLIGQTLSFYSPELHGKDLVVDKVDMVLC
jgi:hypothetical protein